MKKEEVNDHKVVRSPKEKRLKIIACVVFIVILIASYSLAKRSSYIEIVDKPTPLGDIPMEEVVYNLLTTGNGGVQDISAYGLTTKEILGIYQKVQNNKGYIAWKTYYNLTFKTTEKNGKAVTFQLVNTDQEFTARYQRTLVAVEAIRSGIDPNMSDVEKALYIHEYIVSNSTYLKKDNYAYTASGPLALGYGVALGYTEAMILVLKELGIESEYLYSSSMSHGWLIANLDGEWFHIDPTWATTKSSTSGQISHAFFVRTDAEFKNASSSHSGWAASFGVILPTAASRAYANWFVHDVTGQMYYAAGEWYYIWDGDIVKSDINGSDRQVLVKANGGTLSITSFNNGEFTYDRVGGEEPFEEEPSTPEPPPIPEPPAEEEETLEQLIGRLITTGDSTEQDILKYGLTFAQVNAVYMDLIANDCRVAYGCYFNLNIKTTTKSNKIATFQLVNVDDGFAERYEKTKATIAEIRKGIDARMTDAEKTLYVHDYIVDNTYYSTKDNFARVACGPLAMGYAACGGYAFATILVLNELGIETQYISCSFMNHAWLMVKLDGEWYQIDPTWDDTQGPVKGEVGHLYFLRTDSEFKSSLTKKYSGWESAYVSIPTATSTKYSEWYGHDVVGRMHYYNGEWYYSWKGDIVKSDFNGTNRTVLQPGNGKTLLIKDFDSGKFTCRELE